MDLPFSINTCQQSIRGPTGHSQVWYHLHSERIVTTPLDSQLPIKQLQVHFYLVSVTWIYMFFYLSFCVAHVFLLPAASQQLLSWQIVCKWLFGKEKEKLFLWYQTPSYTTDLGPSDNFLFPQIKIHDHYLWTMRTCNRLWWINWKESQLKTSSIVSKNGNYIFAGVWLFNETILKVIKLICN